MRTTDFLIPDYSDSEVSYVNSYFFNFVSHFLFFYDPGQFPSNTAYGSGSIEVPFLFICLSQTQCPDRIR